MSAKVDVRLRRRCGPFAELLWPFVLLIHLHSELEFTSVQLSSTGANRACVRGLRIHCRSVSRSRAACRHARSSVLIRSATATSRPSQTSNDAVPTTHAALGTPATGPRSAGYTFTRIYAVAKKVYHPTSTDNFNSSIVRFQYFY